VIEEADDAKSDTPEKVEDEEQEEDLSEFMVLQFISYI
jgi:hypothetical protein